MKAWGVEIALGLATLTAIGVFVWLYRSLNGGQ